MAAKKPESLKGPAVTKTEEERIDKAEKIRAIREIIRRAIRNIDSGIKDVMRKVSG